MALPTVLAVRISQFGAKARDSRILLFDLLQGKKKININGEGGVLGSLGKSDEQGGFLGFINWITKSSGFLGAIVNWSFSSIASTIVSLVQYFWNFNWNITDQQIDSQIEGHLLAITSIAGGVIGRAVGYTVCGATGSALIGVFNPQAARYAASVLASEAVDDLLGELHGLLGVTIDSALQIAFLRAYQSGRNILKMAQRGYAEIFNFIAPGSIDFGLFEQQMNNTEHFSFAQELEDFIDSINNPFLNAFAENFFDEFGDGCIDAAYILGGAADQFLANQVATNSVLGPETSLIVTPNRELEQETVFLVGNQNILKPALTQTLVNYQLVENRNLGMIVGSPADEFLRAKPQTRRIVLHFYNLQKPPYSSNYATNGLKQTTIAIPDVKSSINWQDIKLACGGENGYLWGRFKATANLNNGRKLVVYGATENEAEQVISRMLLLTQAELLTLSITEEKNEGVRQTNVNYRKESTRMYPAYATILGREKILGSESGTATNLGNFKDLRLRVNLWPERKPDNADQIINQAFANTLGQL